MRMSKIYSGLRIGAAALITGYLIGVFVARNHYDRYSQEIESLTVKQSRVISDIHTLELISVTKTDNMHYSKKINSLKTIENKLSQEIALKENYAKEHQYSLFKSFGYLLDK